tara:strand:- start:453 stop:623 length:171 start_codon:yes stop_codon:yes gene_type:complete
MSCAYKNRKKVIKKINTFKRQGLGVILHDGQVVAYCKNWGERNWNDGSLGKWEGSL